MKKFDKLCALAIGALLVSCGGGGTSSITNTSSQNSTSSVESITSSSQTTTSSESSVSTYTVTFNANGGTFTTDKIVVEIGGILEEPTDKPSRDEYRFTGWCYDIDGQEAVTWPLTVEGDLELYASWSKKVEIKAYLQALMTSLDQAPYSYIPEQMRPTNSANHVQASDVTYDFTSDTQVSSIKYGGFGEQWNMIIENVMESQRFYAVIGLAETVINSSVILFNNYFDSNPSDVASHELNEASYTAKVSFENNNLDYTIKLKSGFNIPLFGEVIPQIDMNYNIETFEKTVRVQLSENNSLKYIVSEDSYEFGLQYGVDSISRKAFFSIERSVDGSIDGKIYEYVQVKGEDLIPSCADFYINDNYVATIGNKASGLVGFKGYIDELYQTHSGKLIAYEVRETLSILGVAGTYNTLWFNLNDISGINSVKAIQNENYGTYGKNNHDIYLNGSSTIFEPAHNSKLGVATSRKYDVELRTQYFYGYENEDLVRYETQVPMMFIQADNDNDANYSDFPSDMLSKNGITASVTLNKTYLNRLQSDYSLYIDLFITHISQITVDYITQFIGNPKEIGE